MKVKLITVGKSDRDFIKSGVIHYTEKLGHYLPFSMVEIPAGNHKNSDKAKNEEGDKILKMLSPRDELLLLDHQGTQMSSEKFADFMQNKMSHTAGILVFVIGGPFGFSEKLAEKSKAKLSLSPMIFSHQIVRLIFLEQLYRAMTIIRKEPYHHS